MIRGQFGRSISRGCVRRITRKMGWRKALVRDAGTPECGDGPNRLLVQFPINRLSGTWGVVKLWRTLAELLSHSLPQVGDFAAVVRHAEEKKIGASPKR